MAIIQFRKLILYVVEVKSEKKIEEKSLSGVNDIQYAQH